MSVAPALQPVPHSRSAPQPGAADRQRDHARIHLPRFVLLLLQLAMLLAFIRWCNIESGAFFFICLYGVAGFIPHYFAPLALKKLVMLAMIGLSATVYTARPVLDESRVSLFLLVGAGMATVLLPALLAAFFYKVLWMKRAFGLRVGLIAIVGALLAWGRSEAFVLPNPYWRIIGTLFMFRLIAYAYEVKIARQRESFTDFLCYIFMLPAYHFPVFPVVDYSTFKKGWLSEDIHATAQRGIVMILRGLLQLCVYRLIYHWMAIGPVDVNSLWTMLKYVFHGYLMYVHVSGQFHVAVGLLHLYGYKLPDTNRWYFLADSFTDYWRRINIYWKDFMVKVFYYPAYFRLRKKNEAVALAVATAWVFLMTTLLHAYQTFWIHGVFELRANDIIFWSLLGLLVWVTVRREMRGGQKKPQAGAAGMALRALRTLGVFVTISVLWSIWNCGSLRTWLDTVMYWR